MISYIRGNNTLWNIHIIIAKCIKIIMVGFIFKDYQCQTRMYIKSVECPLNTNTSLKHHNNYFRIIFSNILPFPHVVVTAILIVH